MRAPLIATTLLLATACTSSDAPAPPRDAAAQRAHDSTIGASSLPGAQGVQGALKVSDSAEARRAREAAAAQEP